MATNTLEYLLKIKDEASKVLNDFGKTAGTTGKKLEALGKGMTNTGTAMVKFGAMGVASLGLATKSAVSFEDAFAGIRKTVDASEAEFAQLSQNIRDIAKSAPVSTEELSKIGELAGQLGVEGVADLTKFTKTIADISVSTNLTSEQASTAFARIFNVMGENLDQVDRMGSAIVDLGNNFATTESDITNFTQRIASSGKIAGMSTADILAIGTAMSSVGVNAEAGGTAVQKTVNKMTEAVATGNADLAVFAETAGLTAEEFKKSYENDAGGAFASFVTGLGEQGNDAFATLDNLQLGNERVINSFLSLANNSGILTDALETSKNAWDGNTALTEEAEKRYKTTASQMIILKNNINDVGITIGTALLPALNGLIQKIIPLITKFSKFAEENPKLVTGILAVIAIVGVVGGVLVVLGTIIGAVGTIITGFTAVIGFLTFPMIAIVAAIAAVIAIGVLLYKNWDKIIKSAKKFGSALKNSITNGLKNAGGAMKSFFIGMIDGAKEGITNLITTIKDIFSGAISLIFEGDFQGAFGQALGLGEDSPIIAGILAFRDKVIEIFGLFVELVKLQLTPFIFIWENIIFPILFLAFAIISRVLFEIYNIFVIIFTAIVTFLTMIFEGIILVVTTVFETLSFIIMTVLTFLWTAIIQPILIGIGLLFTTVWNAIKAVTIGVFTAISTFLTTIWTTIKAVITTVVTSIKTVMISLFTAAKTKVVGIFTALWNAIKAIGESIYNAIVEPFIRALNKIKEIASEIKEAAKKISPFHKSSPSLVELVETGVGKIKRDYASLNSISIPSAQDLAGVNSFAPLTREVNDQEASTGSNVTNTFNVEATINSDMDAEELALILGAQLATSKAY
jgi:TP901 family phage tail tape measure protein